MLAMRFRRRRYIDDVYIRARAQGLDGFVNFTAEFPPECFPCFRPRVGGSRHAERLIEYLAVVHQDALDRLAKARESQPKYSLGHIRPQKRIETARGSTLCARLMWRRQICQLSPCRRSTSVRSPKKVLSWPSWRPGRT